MHKNQKEYQLLQKKIKTKTGKAIAEFGLIEQGDRILLGVSGGKDSMSLLHILANRAKYGKDKIHIEAALIQINNLPIKLNTQYLIDICKQLDVPFQIHKIEIPDNDNRGKNICFLCSWYRRKALFDIAKKLNCNKIALGHNMDDAIETLLMNMAYQGSISSTPASLDLFEGKIKLIRPLIKLTNKELKDYARFLEIPDEIKNCPHERESSRAIIAELIQKLEEQNKSTKYNLFNSMMNIQEDYLPQPQTE